MTTNNRAGWLALPALLSALLPALAFATAGTPRPDPSDAAAHVPAVSAPSVFSDYQPYKAQKVGSWPALNNAVADIPDPPGMDGMAHGGTSPMATHGAAGSADDGNAMSASPHHAQHGAAHQ